MSGDSGGMSDDLTGRMDEHPLGPFVVTADGIVLTPPGFEPGTVAWTDWLDEELSEEQDR
jgi:hypothetical protein